MGAATTAVSRVVTVAAAVAATDGDGDRDTPGVVATTEGRTGSPVSPSGHLTSSAAMVTDAEPPGLEGGGVRPASRAVRPDRGVCPWSGGRGTACGGQGAKKRLTDNTLCQFILFRALLEHGP